MTVRLPLIIHTAWLQGEQAAPSLVRYIFDTWRSLNPEYELRVHTRHSIHELFPNSGEWIGTLEPQALSDRLRILLLAKAGGVWADATLFPTKPLNTWLPSLVSQSGFFAFSRPGPDRLLSSWFLASEPGHLIATRWHREVEDYWRRIRRLRWEIPQDPPSSVNPEFGRLDDTYPYFWFHYLFEYLTLSDREFLNAWQACRQMSADPPHAVQLKLSRSPIDLEAIRRALSDAPVHKLNWRFDDTILQAFKTVTSSAQV